MKQLSVALVSAVFVLASAEAARAANDDDHRHDITIISATVSADQSTLFVEGKGFGSDPRVALDGLLLGGVTVNADGTSLTANMPALQPGSYQLLVQNKRGRQHDPDDDDHHVAA